ncbi:MAG: hypothetical protein AAF678_08865 [Pseudomonadota bacterium]
MQFLEHSFIGLRSARHSLTHSDRDVTVTLFPMVHLGCADFYESVFDDARAHEAVLVEGIVSPVTRRLTRAYRWVCVEKLGLAVQPKFTPGTARLIHADLSGPAFDALWRTAPWRERVLLETLASLMGLWLRFSATRETLGRGLSTHDLTNRDDIMMWNARRAPMLSALKDARDAVLCKEMSALLSEEKGPKTIAVIYGAGHMPALFRSLDDRGFRVTDSRWLKVFET